MGYHTPSLEDRTIFTPGKIVALGIPRVAGDRGDSLLNPIFRRLTQRGGSLRGCDVTALVHAIGWQSRHNLVRARSIFRPVIVIVVQGYPNCSYSSARSRLRQEEVMQLEAIIPLGYLAYCNYGLSLTHEQGE